MSYRPVKKLIVFIIFMAILSLLAAGCQPGQVSSSGSGVLNLTNIDPITLDPAVSGEMTSHEYIMQIFSGLVRLDENLKPAPDIAKGWKLSQDGKTYTFTLRQDVVFQDGRAVKAQDFKYSWERAANPATQSQTAATYLGDVVGVKDMLAGKASEISGVRVIDDYTLQVTIDAPKSYFLAKLTYPTAFVVDKNNVESGAGWWLKPNGTGPFRLKEWQQGSLLTLERNDRYYGGPPSVSQVVYHLWAGAPMNLYETGQIDVAGIGTLYIDRVSDPSGPYSSQLTVAPEVSFSFIGFNATKPPFDDVNIRRAFSMAIDKNKLISLMFRDMVKRADGILPPDMPGYNPDVKGIGFDPAKAKELIKNSKYGDVSKLPPITLTTLGWAGNVGIVEAYIQEWRQNLGVEVKVRQLEPEVFLYNLKQEKDEIFDMGWVADYAHPQDFLDVLFHSNADTNYGEYSNSEVDSLIDRANLELDEKTSFGLYQQAEQKLIDDAACIPLWFGQNYILVKPYIKGFVQSPLGFAEYSRVVIEPH